MNEVLRQFGKALLSIFGLLGGSVLGGILTLLWYASRNTESFTPSTLFGLALTYAGFGVIPSLLFGLPSIRLLKRLGYSLFQATSVLTVGGGLVGAGLMRATFTGLEYLGGTAGAPIGFVLGLLFFWRTAHAQAATA